MVDQTQVELRARELRVWYEGHRYKCQAFRERLERHLARALREASLDDTNIEARTKTVDSYVAKATKLDATGEFKYSDPRTEITDAIGLRVLVPLSTDLAPVARVLQETYVVEEELERGEEEGHVDVPGYRSLHCLVRLSDRDRTDLDFREFSEMVVEIQVRTILQHAWASLQHDLMYKTERPPSPIIRRRLVALAGLLELADREFISVRQAHAAVPEPRRDESIEMAGRVTAASLRHLAEQLLGEEDPAFQGWFVELKAVAADLGLETTEDVLGALGAWRDRAPQVAAAVRVTRPWANSAFLLDVMLRLALRDQYAVRRPPEINEEPLDEREREVALQGFHAELDVLEDELAQI